MADMIFTILTFLFFGLSWAFVHAAHSLRGSR